MPWLSSLPPSLHFPGIPPPGSPIRAYAACGWLGSSLGIYLCCQCFTGTHGTTAKPLRSALIWGLVPMLLCWYIEVLLHEEEDNDSEDQKSVPASQPASQLFIHSFIRSFVHSLIRWFVRSLISWFVRSFVCYFVISFVRSFINSFICSCIHPFIHSSAHQLICSSVHLILRSFVRWFVH